jgi:hypothetical protein
MGRQASTFYSNNITKLLQHMALPEGSAFLADQADNVSRGCTVLHEGELQDGPSSTAKSRGAQKGHRAHYLYGPPMNRALIVSGLMSSLLILGFAGPSNARIQFGMKTPPPPPIKSRRDVNQINRKIFGLHEIKIYKIIEL